jgi:hypothetical protein
MPRPHQPDESTFKAILPEDIKWQSFPAFPPAARLAVMVGDPSEPGPYVVRVKVPGGTKLMPHKHPEDGIYTVMSGVFYIGLGEEFDGDKVGGLSAGQRYRSARRNLALPLGEGRGICHSGHGDWPARP